MNNPYSNINWNTIQHIPSLSHAHSRVGYGTVVKSETQRFISRAETAGIRHCAWSNYYKSIPFYPLTDFFESIPSNMIGSPNAEHHSFTNPGYGNLHMNGIGSLFESGKPQGETPSGTNMSWNRAIPLILSELQYNDGGGISVNHPKWSNLTAEMILPILKANPLVLGIEIANSWRQSENGELNTDIWDAILNRGQRAWGFCAPDHYVESGSQFTGRNVLLVDEFTEYKCLKAYRNGAFYGKLFESNLRFDSIALNGNTFSVSAPSATSIHIIVDGVYHDFNGTSAEYTIPDNAKYCRAEAWLENYEWTHNDGTTSEERDMIFSNPIMFVESKYNSDKQDDFVGHMVSVFDM